MKKNNGFAAFAVISAVIAVFHLIAAIIGITRLPDFVPMHFNTQWVCDGVGSRWILLMVAVLPLIAAAVALALLFSGKLKQPKITAVSVLLTELFMIGVFWLLYPVLNSGVKIGDQINSQPFKTVLPLLFAVLFIILGNYMPIVQPNRTFGLRVPWTLNNPHCWRRTHRFAGKFLFIIGLILCCMILVALALHHAGDPWISVAFFVMVMVCLTVSCIYAYLHRNDTE